MAPSATSNLGPMWKYFHRPGEYQNGHHFLAYCKACVNVYLPQSQRADLDGDGEMDSSAQLQMETAAFKKGARQTRLFGILIVIDASQCF
jgi:hypothetical protein